MYLDVRHALRKALSAYEDPPPLRNRRRAAGAHGLSVQNRDDDRHELDHREHDHGRHDTPIELPPAIKTEGSYRCHGDNSLVKVTFFEAKKDGTMTVAVASPPEAPPVTLSGAAGKPMTADGGWALSGNDKSFKLTQPGKPEQSCSK